MLKIVQLPQKRKHFPFSAEIFELFKIGKSNLLFARFRFLRCQNRQKCAQKPTFCRLKNRKMSKFYLQSANMTIFHQKTRFLFVNFLKRRFVFPVNLCPPRERWKDLFEIVFLDNFYALCYYIIYIWENSAQNCPIGGVCLTRLPNRFARSRCSRVRAGGGARPRE